MNRITRTSAHRLSPRATVISGAALGLVAGATVYGAVSSSAQAPAPAPAAFKTKAPAAAPASLANCAAGAKLEKGVCVVHVVRTIILPPSAAPVAARAKVAPATRAIPRSTARPASAAPTGSPQSDEASPKAAACTVVKADGESKDGEDSEDASRPASGAPAPAPVACSAAAPAPAPSAAS